MGQWIWTIKGTDWVSGCEQWKGQSGTLDVNSERVRLGHWMWTVKGSDWVTRCEQWKGQTGTVDVNNEWSDRVSGWWTWMGVLDYLDSGSQWVTGDGPTVKGSEWDSGGEQWRVRLGQWMWTVKGQTGTLDVNSERVRQGQWMMDMNGGIGLHG